MYNKFKPLELKFTYFKCFGDNNIIDFRKNIDNKNIEIIAPNSYGKTSIVEVILFCLYGNEICRNYMHPYEHNYEQIDYSSIDEFFNSDNDNFYCSLMFTVNDTNYRIVRTGTIKYTNIEIMLYKIENKIEKLITNSLHNINYYINNLVGLYDDFLMNSLFDNLYPTKCMCFSKLSAKRRYLYLTHIINQINDLAPVQGSGAIFPHIVNDIKKFSQEELNDILNKYVSEIEFFVNDLLKIYSNMIISLKVKSNKIIFKVKNDMSYNFYNVKKCSYIEKLFIDIIIKYAFMKIFSCIKTCLLIVDLTGIFSDLYIENLKKFFRKIHNDGINVFVIGIDKKLHDDNNYSINIIKNINNRISLINNTM